MADDDRWRGGEDRYPNEWRGHDRQRGGGSRHDTDYDRDRRAGGYGGGESGGWREPGAGTSFGPGSRDFGEGRSGGGYGGDWGRNDWRDADRYGSRDRDFGSRSGYGGGYGEGGGMGRDRRDIGGRSMSDLAFGRDASGRDSSGRDYGRRDWGGGHDDRGFFERAGDEVASWFGDEDAERRRRTDQREDDRYGEHRGRGPKSYQRSDERIRDDLNDRLTDDPRLDASEIEVSVSGREVTLSGTVNSRADKRRAEDLADSISGVTHVQNNLRVQNQTGGSWGGDQSFATGSAVPGSAAAGVTAGGSRTGTAYETAGAGTASNRTGSRQTTKG